MKSKSQTKSKELSVIVKRIEFHKNEIAKHRDFLREISNDLESIVDATETGVNELEAAIDTLSQYL